MSRGRRRPGGRRVRGGRDRDFPGLSVRRPDHRDAAPSRPGRVFEPLLLTVVVAVLLTACAGAGSDPAAGGTTPSARPTPTATSSPTPSSTRPPSPTASPTPRTAAEITEAVTHWYEYGGETAMVSLIEEAEKAQFGRPRENGEFELVTLDFSGLEGALSTARLFGSIPDPQTQRAWSAAIDRLDEGAREVLSSVPENRTFQSPVEAGQAARGWNTFDEGLKSLKKTGSRLDRTFGLKPPSDPWDEG